MATLAPTINLARWLPLSTPAIQRSIVERAMKDIGICEMPPGSNRSGVIDAYNQAVGAPVASYWCASALSAWYREAGAEVPGKFGSAGCDEWMKWGKQLGRWTSTPVPGAAVLYGVPNDAQHIGVVVRVGPLILSVEGNTSLGGFSRNGVAVDLKEVNAGRLLGYITPVAAAL